MLAILAWRNVWRHKGRSAVVIGAMVVGIWSLTFGAAFMNSFLLSYIETAIRHEVSNGQIHHPEFTKDFDIKFTITEPERIVDFLKKNESIAHVTHRSIVNGMIASTRQATGVRIIGVEPAEEARVTVLDSLISEGSYFEGVTGHPVLLGRRLSERLKVGLK